MVSCGQVALFANVGCCLTGQDVNELEEKFLFLSLPIFIIIQAVDPICLFGRLIICAAKSIMIAHSG